MKLALSNLTLGQGLGTTRDHSWLVKPDQEQIAPHQVEIVRRCLAAGNKNGRLREYVLRNTGLSPEHWNQTLIFLGLSLIAPEDMVLSPNQQIDKLWHRFILCTCEYEEFCLEVCNAMIHHVPDGLLTGKQRTQWQPDGGIEQFIACAIPEFDARLWLGDSAQCSTDG